MNLGGYSATGPRETNEDSFYVLDFSDVHGFTGDIAAFVMVSDGMLFSRRSRKIELQATPPAAITHFAPTASAASRVFRIRQSMTAS